MEVKVQERSRYTINATKQSRRRKDAWVTKSGMAHEILMLLTSTNQTHNHAMLAVQLYTVLVGTTKNVNANSIAVCIVI